MVGSLLVSGPYVVVVIGYDHRRALWHVIRASDGCCGEVGTSACSVVAAARRLLW